MYAADRSPSAEHDDDERSSDAVTCTRERRLLLQHTAQCNAPTVLLWHKHSSKAVKRRESLGRIARVELNSAVLLRAQLSTRTATLACVALQGGIGVDAPGAGALVARWRGNTLQQRAHRVSR